MSSTKPKSKRGRPRKEPIMQIHGKEEKFDGKTMPSSLDEILKENLSVYSAQSSEEYRSQLAEMNMTDLQAHAYKIGLVPTEDRRLLTDRLVHEYMKWSSMYGSSTIAGNVQTVGQLDARALKILREGA